MGVMNLANSNTPGDPNMPDPSFVATDTPAIAVKKNALLPMKMSYHQMDSIINSTPKSDFVNPPPPPPPESSNPLLPEPKVEIKKEIKKEDGNKNDNNIDKEMPPPSHIPPPPPPPIKTQTKTPSRKNKKERSVSRTSSVSSKRSVTPYVSIDISPLPSIVLFYSGEASMNDKTVDEYIQIGNSAELLSEADFETNIAVYILIFIIYLYSFSCLIKTKKTHHFQMKVEKVYIKNY